MNEKISVIVPVFNVEQYLERSLRSIMNQTYSNLEIICINDGSTDGSLAILEKLAGEDRRISVISQPNSGLGPTKNRGIEASTGEWISFIDSDDTILPDTYELCAKCFDAAPGMIHFGIRVVREDGLPPQRSDMKYYSLNYSGLEDMNPDLMLGTDKSSNNKIFRRSVLDRYGIRFGKIRYEDFQFTTSYESVIDNVYYIPTAQYLYLRRACSIMADSFAGTPKAIDHLKAFENAYRFVEGNGRLAEYWQTMGRLFVSSYFFALRFTPFEMKEKAVLVADRIYSQYKPLRDVVDRRVENGTVLFEMNRGSHLVSKYLQYLFSLRREFVNYRSYKVMRIFNIIVMSRPLSNSL